MEGYLFLEHVPPSWGEEGREVYFKLSEVLRERTKKDTFRFDAGLGSFGLQAAYDMPLALKARKLGGNGTIQSLLTSQFIIFKTRTQF